MIKLRLLISTIFVFLTVSAYAQPIADVQLYLRPFETTGKPVATMSLEELLTKEPQAMIIDDEVSDEWFWIEQAGSYNGYVSTSKISKDLSIQSGTYIYENKETDSLIVATVTDPKTVTILDLQGEWVSVLYNGEAPLYFQQKGLSLEQLDAPQQLPIEASPAKVSVPSSQVMPITEAPASMVEDDIPTVQYFTLDGEPIDPDTIVISDVDAPPSGSSNYTPTLEPLIIEPLDLEGNELTDIAESQRIQALDTTRYFEGRLKRNKGLELDLILFRNKKYDYILEGYDGKNLAYIDASDLIHSTALEKLLDERIVIHGTAEKTQASPPLVIYARHIQIK